MESEPSRPWLSHYPPSVPPQIEIPDISLPELLHRSVTEWPDRAALIYYGARTSYAGLWEASGRAAAGFLRDGLRPGDRVALYLPNCPAYPIAFYGALRAGLSVVQVSPLYLGQDLTHLLQDARPQAIVTLEILYPNLRAVHGSVAVPREYVARLRSFYPRRTRWLVNAVLRRRGLPTSFPTEGSVRPWSGLARPGAPPERAIDPAREVAVFQYTGGTTGEPKAALLSHRNLVANALQCRAWFGIQPPGTGVVLASIPLFHIYGLTVAMTFPFSEGATIVLQTRPDVDEILALIRKYHPTEFPGVPALYHAINLHPRTARVDLRSIRVCVSGSAPLPRDVAERFRASTGAFLLEGYGLTEASPVTHANPVGGEARDGSIGIPFPLTDQKLVDPEDPARPAAPGAVGELCVRGPQVMLGYYGRPAETAEVLRDGWLRTGDLARLDADGYAYIVDRKKDMIDVGGLKVYPREVEEVLYQHPEVQEATVLGLPDPGLGEVVAAVIVRRPGATVSAEALTQFVRERIAHYKAPRRIEFRDQLPRSAIQKVLRRILREELSGEGAGVPAAVPGPPPGPPAATAPAR